VEINVRKQAEVHVLRLQGDLKRGDPVDDLKQTLDELVNSGEVHIVVNVEQVNMIDSSGIGVLVRTFTHAKQAGGSLKLVKPSRLATQTLKVVGLSNLFEIYEEEDEALASFQEA
jgi:anti-sigma B factor antagonist